MLSLKPQLTLSCFSAYPTAGLVVLTKVNCTSSVIKDYRKKNKIKSVHAIGCLINVLTWDFFVLNLFCVHYQFFTNSCWTWQIWKRLTVFLNDGESLQYGEKYGKPFNWYPLLKLFVHFQMQVGFFLRWKGFWNPLKRTRKI